MTAKKSHLVVVRRPPSTTRCRKSSIGTNWSKEAATMLVATLMAKLSDCELRRAKLEATATTAFHRKFAIELEALHGPTPWEIPHA